VISGPGIATADAAAAIAVSMLILWAVGTRIRDVSIVDLFWGPAFVLVALIVAVAGSGDAGRRWLLLALTAAWGLRLGVHLTLRKLREHGEDARYAAMRLRQGGRFVRWSLVWIFGIQGAMVLIVSLPIQVGGERGGALTPWVIPGLVLFAVGLLFEAVGDEQLRRFKAVPANGGRVMERGLWRYTRHPNYFGDFCVWWGLWLVVLPAGGTWWTIVGPLVMSVLLIRVSGKALLERSMAERRPAYADYVRSTSGFVPRPPRRRR
jgi:steroid 5-alpha reductase family enzyme